MAPFLVLPEIPRRIPGCYWRPNVPFVAELAKYLAGKRVLEVFAGNGYLSAILHAQGVRITATSNFAGHDAHESGLYGEVLELSAVQAVRKFGEQSDVLLICWPTVTPEVLRCVQGWGPDRDIVYIGEVTDYAKGHFAGCATDEFFEAIKWGKRFVSYSGNMLEVAMCCRLRSSLEYKKDLWHAQ